MMGRKPRLAVDLNMGTNLPEHGPTSSYKYVQDLERRLLWSHKLAQKQMEKMANKAKKYYDRRVRCSKLEPGDLVLVKKFGFRGKHKIQDRWENQVYEVLESCHSSPVVFRIRREDGTGNMRVIHRNLLLPFRSRILDEATTPHSPDPVDDSQSDEQVESIQEDQEDSPEDETDSQSVSEDDDPAVSARPWTRSQGPPPALVGTTSLSKCSFNSQHSLLPYQVVLTRGHSGRLVGWASPLWRDVQLFV